MSKDPLKVVVRLLPPEITEEELLGTINQTHVQRTKWRSFHPGKRYKGEAKPSVNTRCYFQFETNEYAEEFIKDYHGHQFIDGQGEQFRAVACFAPYQKAPRTKPQKDPREGTIADDPVYKEFLESLAEASKVVYEAPPDPKVLLKPLDYGDTPLLKFMQTRAKERRARAEKKAKRWREMESISEDPKKAKWRCAECGTSKHLEEDPDDRGTFYCTYCWESWESTQAPVKVKKKKKKSKEADDAEAYEETEEVTTKKKKKKKDKDYEADEEVPHKSEWRVKDKGGHEGEEEDGDKRRRRKKDKEKDRHGEGAEEEEDRGKSNRWRVKKTEAAEENDEDWGAEKRHGKARGSQKGGQDDWWEEDKSQKRSSDRSKPEKKSEHAADDGRGSRWRAKAPAGEEGGGEAEEKPRQKGGRERKGEGGEGAKWRPKS